MSDPDKDDLVEAAEEEAASEDHAHFEMDASLQAALAEAEAYADAKRKPRAGAGVEVEIEVEDDAPAAPAAPAASGAGEGVVRALAEMRKARDEAEAAEAKAKDLEERLLRTAADFENYKKRMTRDREQEKKFANESIVKDVLPVIDNLERALEAGPGTDPQQLFTGVDMVRRQLVEVLGRYGLEQFTAQGKPFDPELHEAMQQVETDEVPPGHVLREFVRGYALHGRLVRPAMVVVAAAPSGANTKSAEAAGGADSREDGGETAE